MFPQPARILPNERARSRLADVLVLGIGLTLFTFVLSAARNWLGPQAPTSEISRNPSALPIYAAYSVLRLGVAYAISLVFALAYGYTAAHNKKAEKILIPMLDILQSIPVLSFLPGVMLAMAALFPSTQIGIELGSILLIFTGQVWNIAFSFYSSLNSIPRELYEAARVNRFSRWQQFTQLELPYSTIGVVWNSMMSVAGGWFFLMVCEMFPLGDRQVRLPGLGSYIQTAASEGDIRAILWGLGAMVAVIVLLDQLVWRPAIAWSDKFKFEQVESAAAPQSAVLNLLRRSRAIDYIGSKAISPLAERCVRFFSAKGMPPIDSGSPARKTNWLGRLTMAALLAAALYGIFRAAMIMANLTTLDLAEIGRGAGATFLRVSVSLLIGAAWTIPVGVFVGFNPRVLRFAAPLAQIAASIPATGLFPVVLLVLMRFQMVHPGDGLGLTSVLLMLLGTQWYILFNVIAGATAIPTDLKEAAAIFRFGRWDRWRLLILPGIFPYLITGLVTAAGGAWNASIVAEYIPFQEKVLYTTGLGATISRASSEASTTGNFSLLLAATVAMALMVVIINRNLWRRLYRLAETRFKLET
jgi:NitT/TauT family transport system permease protein